MTNKYDKYEHLPPIVECLYAWDFEPLIHLRQVKEPTAPAVGFSVCNPLYYCHRVHDDKWGFSVYVVVEITLEELAVLRANKIDIRSVLDGKCWHVMNDDGSHHIASDVQCVRLEGMLPKPGVKLYHENSAANESTA